jgi:lipopolysaccharide export system protein LptA
MARVVNRSFVSNLRKLLLAALVIALVGLVSLFLFGRSGRTPGGDPEVAEDTQAGKGVTLIGEDFDYTFTERERPIFRIRGESVRADREGVLYLDGVGLTLYDEKGRPFHVESREANFNRTTNEGQLQGDVFLKGPEGLELRTARLDLKSQGRVLVSRADVEIRYAEQYVVRAGRMQINLPQELYVLAENVKVNSVPGVEPPASLTAQRLVYERDKRWLRVEGGSDLRRGPQQLSAKRISAKLSPDESSLIFVRAFWGVTGRTIASLVEAGGSDRTTIRFSGKDLAVILQPEGNEVRKLELEGVKKGQAMIEAVGGGLTRTLKAFRIEGVMDQGVLSEADALGGVEIRETARGVPPRQAVGDRGKAVFRPDGQLATMDLIGNVTYQDGQVKATGDRADVDMEAGRGEFTGKPVEVVSDRGRLSGPRVTYNTEHEVLQASGGVRAVLEKVSETALAGSPLGEGEGPVYVESREAFWRREPSSFIFRGDVRSWRGENLLLASEMRGDQEQDKLTATGGVKTLWIPRGDEAVLPTGSDGRRPGGNTPAAKGKAAPIEVLANDLAYQQGAGVLTYTGNVRVEQEGRTLACQKLDVELGEGEERKVETMTCTGDVKLNDPPAGRRVEGQKAVYAVVQRTIEMFGEPVTMRDKTGNVVRGRRLIYNLDNGKVEVKGGSSPASPASPAPSATPAAPAPGTGTSGASGAGETR